LCPLSLRGEGASIYQLKLSTEVLNIDKNFVSLCRGNEASLEIRKAPDFNPEK
jgi:hypothetical protein